MHGPLNEIALIEVLQLLERGRRSGVLQVTGTNPDQPRRLHLADGIIVALEPDAGEGATLAALVSHHLVTDTEAADDPAILRRPIAGDVRARRAMQVLSDMLHWRRGRFDFREGPVDSGPLALSPDAMVFRLVESETRRVDLASAMSDFRAIPDFAAEERLAAGVLPPMVPRDWRLLDMVDGVRNVAELAVVLDEPLEDVASSVQALQAAAILELRAPVPLSLEPAPAEIDAGQCEAAAPWLRARVSQHPPDAESCRLLGLAEAGSGRFERAIEAWQAWRAIDPERAGDAGALIQAARTMLEALRDSRD